MNQSELKRLHIDSMETFDRMVQWGWIDARGNSVNFATIVKTPRRQYFVLEEVENVEDADVVMVGGKTYPIKEKDLVKLKASERRNKEVRR